MNTAPAQRSGAGYGPILGLPGIGLRPQHHALILEQRPQVAWFEAHAESFMTRGVLLEELDSIARDYPLSLHATGLSLGSVALPEREHLNRLQHLAARYEPDLISDHLSWSASGRAHLPELPPLPYTEEALHTVIRNVLHVQERLKRQILLENPSKCARNPDSSLSEAEFLAEVVLRTGCGVLLDLNNLYVSACNQGIDAGDALTLFLDTVPEQCIAEIHLSGRSETATETDPLTRIDDRGARVSAEVWALYESAAAVLGVLPTLIESDTQIPSFEVLQDQAAIAQSIADRAF